MNQRWIAVAALLAAGAARADGFHAGVLLNGGLPAPLGVELFARNDLFGIGVGYAALPEALGDKLLSLAGVNNATLAADAIEVDLRLFPFLGSFFVGASAGRQSITATTSQQGQTGTVSVTTLMAAPRLGWLWRFGPGIALGFDLGVQIPFAASKAITPPVAASNKDINDAADVVGSTPLPSIHLRVGYLF